MDLLQSPDIEQHSIRVLIVEDEAMIALSLEEELIVSGYEIVGVTGRLERALALIESGACDAAIVDANLAGVSASPVADALAIRSLPFIVMSGYSQDQMRSQFAGAAFIQKPCRPAMLIQTLNALLLNA